MYAYNADTWCDDCVMVIINDLRANGTINDGTTDTWPQTYGDNTESDCPQHCSHCRVFLENQLTGDGYDYVFQEWLDDSGIHMGEGDVLREWLDYYSELDISKRCEEYICDQFKRDGGKDALSIDLFAVVQKSKTYNPEDIDDGDGPSIDVRLRYFQGCMYFYTGDSSYDQDHRGFWGSSSVGPHTDLATCSNIANDLLDQVLENMSQVGDMGYLSEVMS